MKHVLKNDLKNYKFHLENIYHHNNYFKKIWIGDNSRGQPLWSTHAYSYFLLIHNVYVKTHHQLTHCSKTLFGPFELLHFFGWASHIIYGLKRESIFYLSNAYLFIENIKLVWKIHSEWIFRGENLFWKILNVRG